MLPVGYSGLTKPAQLTAHEVSRKSFSAVIQLLVVTPTSHVTSLPEVPIALSSQPHWQCIQHVPFSVPLPRLFRIPGLDLLQA